MRDMGESGPLNSAAAREVTISLVTINPRCQPAVMRCELYMYLMTHEAVYDGVRA